MDDEIEEATNLPANQQEKGFDNVPPALPRIPQYSRDISPTNVSLTANDIRELTQLIDEANARARNLEFASLNLDNFDSPEDARNRISDLMPTEYNYRAGTGDNVSGLGIPNVDDASFPDDLASFFVSNSSYTDRAIGQKPLNVVDVFLAFEKPSLKMDLLTLPSNPTENRSIINIYGRDEDWVISTTDRIEKFFDRRGTFRPAIHGSGAYDYFAYFLFLPILLLLYINFSNSQLATWVDQQSTFINVVLALYAFLVSLLAARFSFQYIRWLLPPMEFYKRSKVGAYVHRAVAGFVLSGLAIAASWDILKWVWSVLFG